MLVPPHSKLGGCVVMVHPAGFIASLQCPLWQCFNNRSSHFTTGLLLSAQCFPLELSPLSSLFKRSALKTSYSMWHLSQLIGAARAVSQLQEALWWGLHKPEGRVVPAEMPRLSLCLSPSLKCSHALHRTNPVHTCMQQCQPAGLTLNMHTNGPMRVQCVFPWLRNAC